jgi:hypothetical protein
MTPQSDWPKRRKFVSTKPSKYNKGDIITDGKLTVLIINITNNNYIFKHPTDISFQYIELVDNDPDVRLATKEEEIEYKARQI